MTQKPKRPASGGRYVRDANGKLTRVEFTAPPVPGARPDPEPAVKPAPKKAKS